MKPFVRPLLAFSALVAASCSSGGNQGQPGAAGTGTGVAGTGGSSSPDAAAGTGGSSTPDAAAGTGGGGGGSLDAAPDLPVGPGITIIQEDQPGFAAVDGKVYPRQGSTNVTGYTGTGFADGDPGVGKTIGWSVKAETAGTYMLVWRYAFGGLATNLRDGKPMINGAVAADAVTFAYTTDWNIWQETPALAVQLAAGSNFIQLQAINASGLANIDYLMILGEGITPTTPASRSPSRATIPRPAPSRTRRCRASIPPGRR